MDDLQRLIEADAIRTLMARRVRCIDEKDWTGLAECYSEDAVSYSFGDADGTGVGLVGSQKIADQTAKVLEGFKTVHQVHTPEIEFQSATQATGIWPLHDTLVREQDGKRFWMRAFGHYRQSYEKIDGCWQITKHRLTRLLVETGTGDVSDEAGVIPAQ